MPGITNEHDVTPLFDGERSDKLGAGSGFVPVKPDYVRTTSAPTVRGRIAAVRKLLDGVSGLGWSVIGFLVGAVFWHFVGFWGFVANVVLAGGPGLPASSAHSLKAAERVEWVRMADAAAPASAACTMLFLDRQTGLTSAHECDGDHPPLPADSFEGREDRIVTSGGEPEALHDPGLRHAP